MSGPVPSGIAPLLPLVAEGAAAIESAFLSAGQGLSQGLSAFGTLTTSLAALDGGFAAAPGLGRMSQRLRTVADRMPVDAAALGRLIAGNHGMRRRFDDLVGDMRMMVIVSRSARLEAVVSPEQRASVEDFSRTIDQEIGSVQARLDACAAEHRKITAALDRGARAQAAFDGEFGGRLADLAADLDAALQAIDGRRRAGLALAAEAGARARDIARSTGTALVSLQIGDTTRQRLEHVHHALERAQALAGGGETATADLLCRLQEAQLRDSVAVFAEEGAFLLDAFCTLSREAGHLVAAGQATYGQGAEGPASFMAAFRTRLDTAMGLVGACDASRASVKGAIGDLGAMLGTLDETLTTLGRTSEDLVIVAVNVGLKAARLGAEGRGLVTVAGELKRLSGQLALQAEGLLSTFEAVRREADHFLLAAEEDLPGSPTLAEDAAAILDALAHDDATVVGVLADVQRTGRDFDATMATVTRDFEAVMADHARLADVADRLADAGPAAPAPPAPPAAIQAVDALMLPLYSMAQERDIHAAIVGASPVDEAQAA